jgi:hypothetical protein
LDAAGLPTFDGWELDEELRHVERLLASRSKAAPERQLRIDAAHVTDEPRRSATPRGVKPKRRDSQRSGPALVWPLLSLGMMTFVCGGVLVGWSVLSARADLWNIGLPIALLGQIALLAGLALQLERIWTDYRETASKLEHVDDELHDLKTTTTLLGTSQSTAGNSFYAHMAGGAGPQLLLADLKSQLDLLAVRISQKEND